MALAPWRGANRPANHVLQIILQILYFFLFGLRTSNPQPPCAHAVCSGGLPMYDGGPDGNTGTCNRFVMSLVLRRFPPIPPPPPPPPHPFSFSFFQRGHNRRQARLRPLQLLDRAAPALLHPPRNLCHSSVCRGHVSFRLFLHFRHIL
jgi:hypothetical protein